MKFGTRSTKSHSALTWRAFFNLLASKPHVCNTEKYVSTFSEAFKLAKAPYQLGNRVVML